MKWLDVFSKWMSPVTRFLGMNENTSTTLAAGLVFGLAYGSGVMIQAVKEDGVSKKDLTLAFIFLCTCHAVFEDTLIFLTVGISVLPILLIRLGIAIILTASISFIWNKVDMAKERNSQLMDNKITTLLFDLDGTLIDTNELIIKSFMHTLGHYYPDRYKREDILPFMGPPLVETFSSIDPERTEEMVQRYFAV